MHESLDLRMWGVLVITGIVAKVVKLIVKVSTVMLS